jgi:hypothetical protein
LERRGGSAPELADLDGTDRGNRVSRCDLDRFLHVGALEDVETEGSLPTTFTG